MSQSKYWSIEARGNKSADVFIYEQIGGDMFSEGVGAKQFAKDLKDLGDVSTINLHINSPGGSVFEGLAIYNMLKAHGAAINVHIDGLAASIASVVAMAGSTITMPENAMLMIHDPWTMAVGDADDLRKSADVLDKVKEGLITAYQAKCKKPKKYIADLMEAETWMTAAEAAEEGFCDRVTDAVKIAALSGLEKFKHTPQALIAPGMIPRQPQEGVNMATKCKNHPGTDMIADRCPACDADAQAQAAVKQAREAEVARANALRTIGREFDCAELADYGVLNGWSEDVLRKEIMARKKAEAEITGKPLNLTGAKVTPAHDGKPFRSFGEQLIAVANHARGKHDPRLNQVYNAASGAGEAVPSDGGFLVQSDFTTSLLDKADAESVFYPRCMKIQVAGNGIEAPVIDETNRATGSRWGGVQIYRVNEGATVTAKKPKFAKISMKLEKIMGLAYATDEVLQDASALEGILSRSFVSEFAFVRENEIFTGTGAGQMLGFMNAGCLVTVSKETGQTAATVVIENLMNMYACMPARNKANAAWFINSEVMPQLMQLTMPIGTGGMPVFMPGNNVSGAPFGTIFGKPVIESEHCLALGTSGDIVFCDMSEFLIIEKGGLNAARDLSVRFIYDEMTFRWTTRNNGQPIPRSAITPYKGSLTYSPFIALQTRS